MAMQLMELFPEMSPQDFDAYSPNINMSTSFMRTPVPDAVGIASTSTPQANTALLPALFRGDNLVFSMKPALNDDSLAITSVKPAAETGIVSPLTRNYGDLNINIAKSAATNENESPTIGSTKATAEVNGFAAPFAWGTSKAVATPTNDDDRGLVTNSSKPAAGEITNLMTKSFKSTSEDEYRGPTFDWNTDKSTIEFVKPAAKDNDTLISNSKPAADPTPPSTTSKAIRQPNKKPKSRGRSNGDKSSDGIKALRAQAENGDFEAAFKLGWGVDRHTEIFNRNKAAKGEKVEPGQAIDDAKLIARINMRQKNQAYSQKMRQERLRQQAEAGDEEAARKLKWGKRTMANKFPSMKAEEGAHQSREATEENESEISGSRSPAEPFNFVKKRAQMQNKGEVAFHGLPVPSQPASTQYMGASGLRQWSAVPETNSTYKISQAPPAPQYPISSPVFDPERAYRREYDAAKDRVAAIKKQVALAEAEVEAIKQKLEELQVEKSKKKRKTIVKLEGDAPNKPHSHKKARRARLSNFPIEPIKESVGGEMQAYGSGTPAAPISQGMNSAVQVYQPHIPAF